MLHQGSDTIRATDLSGNCQCWGGRIHVGRSQTQRDSGEDVSLPDTDLEPRAGFLSVEGLENSDSLYILMSRITLT